MGRTPLPGVGQSSLGVRVASAQGRPGGVHPSRQLASRPANATSSPVTGMALRVSSAPLEPCPGGKLPAGAERAQGLGTCRLDSDPSPEPRRRQPLSAGPRVRMRRRVAGSAGRRVAVARGTTADRGQGRVFPEQCGRPAGHAGARTLGPGARARPETGAPGVPGAAHGPAGPDAQVRGGDADAAGPCPGQAPFQPERDGRPPSGLGQGTDGAWAPGCRWLHRAGPNDPRGGRGRSGPRSAEPGRGAVR